MMEKRNLFKSFFKKRNPTGARTRLEMMNGYNATYSNVGDEIFDVKIARQCIDRIATHIAKLEPKHIKASLALVQNSNINYLLSNQPNKFMSTYDFLYKTASMLYTDANAFVYKEIDGIGNIVAFYPILARNYELLEDENNTIWLKFTFINGQTYQIPYSDIIHLRLFYNRNDLFGTSDDVLKTDLETAQTSSEGIKNAIRTSTSLRGILKYQNSQIKEKDLIKNKEAFVEDFANLNNTSGIAALDGKADFTPLDMKPITLDAEQLNRVNYNVYDYFGISSKIIDNSFSDDEWNAFYEGVIEPRAMQMAYEFTNKIFNKKAIKDGHKIVFTTNRLMYATLDSKVNLLKNVASFGMIKTDEAREILGLPPIGGEEGNRILQSLNNVDTTIANAYQLSKGGN